MRNDDRASVLLVDDRADNRLALKSVLGDMDIDFVEAESGEEALKRLLDGNFAVILLDVEMPGMDGFETATVIRQRERSCHTPIIFVTAHASREEHVFRGYETGAVDYIFKPFLPEILRSKVAVFVDLFRKTQQLHRLNQSLEQKVADRTSELRVLLKEVHHRVKNNLQVISSLLNLQSTYLKDEADREIFRKTKDRIRSMALIHEELYRSRNMASIDIADYIRCLAAELFRSYGVDAGLITLETRLEDIQLGVDTGIPCGLILNELLSNSLKYAFPSGRKGEIRIDFHSEPDGTLTLGVADNGVGYPRDLDAANTDTLGLRLVYTLIRQLGGKATIANLHGAEFRVTIPVPRQGQEVQCNDRGCHWLVDSPSAAPGA